MAESVGTRQARRMEHGQITLEELTMGMHRDVSDVINKVVLRDVVQIHGTEITYPALPSCGLMGNASIRTAR